MMLIVKKSPFSNVHAIIFNLINFKQRAVLIFNYMKLRRTTLEVFVSTKLS